jgi:hypothetical protein
MNILIVTPLYPPDIKEPAPYVKEVATRLKEKYTVSILAYNHIPEKVDGVTITTVEKTQQVFSRMFSLYKALSTQARKTDILFVQNGPSVEVPLLVFLLMTRIRPRTVLRLGDRVPLLRTYTSFLASWITHLLLSRVDIVLTHEDTREFAATSRVIPRPHARPEILPFEPRNDVTQKAYETSWTTHLDALHSLFSI